MRISESLTIILLFASPFLAFSAILLLQPALILKVVGVSILYGFTFRQVTSRRATFYSGFILSLVAGVLLGIFPQPNLVTGTHGGLGRDYVLSAAAGLIANVLSLVSLTVGFLLGEIAQNFTRT